MHIDVVGTALINPQHSAIPNLMAFSSLTESNKTVFNNGTTYYGDSDTMGKLAEVAKQFKPSLWTNTGTIVDFSKGPKNHEIVNTGSNKLHKQGRMKWSRSTLLTYSCFVG